MNAMMSDMDEKVALKESKACDQSTHVDAINAFTERSSPNLVATSVNSNVSPCLETSSVPHCPKSNELPACTIGDVVSQIESLDHSNVHLDETNMVDDPTEYPGYLNESTIDLVKEPQKTDISCDVSNDAAVNLSESSINSNHSPQYSQQSPVHSSPNSVIVNEELTDANERFMNTDPSLAFDLSLYRSEHSFDPDKPPIFDLFFQQKNDNERNDVIDAEKSSTIPKDSTNYVDGSLLIMGTGDVNPNESLTLDNESPVYEEDALIESVVCGDQTSIDINKSSSDPQNEPQTSQNELSAPQSDTRLHLGHSMVSSPMNVSRSYIISEDGSHLMVDQSLTIKDSDMNMSKSYIVSETNEIDGKKENQCLSDIMESQDNEVITSKNIMVEENPDLIQQKIIESSNIQLDSIDTEGIKQSVEALLEDHRYVGEEEEEEEDYDPPSLKSIKSIAEKKKKRMMDNQNKRCLIIDMKVENRYSKVGVEHERKSSQPQALRGNIKKDKELISAKLIKKNTSTTTKTSKFENRASQLRNDFHARSKQGGGREDILLKEVQQLQALNEKERKKCLKVHQNLISSQTKWKNEKEKMCSDYEKKLNDLNKKMYTLRKKQNVDDTNAVINKNGTKPVDDDTVESLQKQLALQETMIAGFQEENKQLYDQLKTQDDTLKEMKMQAGLEKKELFAQNEDLKMTHLVEIEKLQKKLKWYAENQVLLDKDLKELKDSREEIKNLKTTIEQLESDTRRLRNENTKMHEERNNQADLAKEKTFPGVNPPLEMKDVILDEKKSELIHNREDGPLMIYFEGRIKTLEEELEEKDDENAKKIRAIEQKYSVVTLDYEEQIRKLDHNVAELTVENQSVKDSLIQIENDMHRKTNESSMEILELRNQIKAKDQEIEILNQKLNDTLIEDVEKQVKPSSTLHQQLDNYKKKLKQKDVQINELRDEMLLLVKDKKLLTDELQQNQAPMQTFRKDIGDMELIMKDKYEIEMKYMVAVKEIEELKCYIEELQIEGEEKRLRYEAIDVKSQNDIRNLNEKFEEDKRKCEENQRKIIEKMKMDYAVEHSNSKVAELNGKLNGLELIVDHLKNTLDETRVDRHRFNQMKITEEELQKKILSLERELMEVQAFDTPEVKDYKLLLAKITTMEKNHYNREEKLQNIIESTKCKAISDIEDVEEQWREKLRGKDIEIEKFRVELDGIIEVLQELQRQGVELPKSDLNPP